MEHVICEHCGERTPLDKVTEYLKVINRLKEIDDALVKLKTESAETFEILKKKETDIKTLQQQLAQSNNCATLLQKDYEIEKETAEVMRNYLKQSQADLTRANRIIDAILK